MPKEELQPLNPWDDVSSWVEILSDYQRKPLQHLSLILTANAIIDLDGQLHPGNPERVDLADAVGMISYYPQELDEMRGDAELGGIIEEFEVLHLRPLKQFERSKVDPRVTDINKREAYATLAVGKKLNGLAFGQSS